MYFDCEHTMLLGIVKRKTERRRASRPLEAEARARVCVGDPGHGRVMVLERARPRKCSKCPFRAITVFDFREQHRPMPDVPGTVARFALATLLALALAAPALGAGEPRHVKPDRAAIDKLLDEFIPAVVRQENLKLGWTLVGGVERTTSHAEWLRGNTSVQTYPAKGKTFRGWIVNYSYPGDVGFDILLQPTSRKLGAWSFRAEAQKIHGAWKITTW